MPDPKPNEAEAAAPKKKSSLKILILVVAVMLLEGATIVGVAMFTSAPEAKATEGFTASDTQNEERIIEIPVLHDRFPNNKQGIPFLYDTEITIQVKARNKEAVEGLLKENNSRIKMSMATIIRQAEPRHFDEPYLNTLTRQVEERLKEVVGLDPTNSESRLEGVLIPSLIPIPSS